MIALRNEVRPELPREYPVKLSRRSASAYLAQGPADTAREVPGVPRDEAYAHENANAIYTDSSLARFRGGNPFIHHG